MEKFEPVITCLREQRLKLGIDYAIVAKYGEVRILANTVYQEIIEREFAAQGININEFYTFLQ